MTMAAPAADAPIVVWFRRDLRLGDHPALADAVASGRPIVPLFVREAALLAPRTVAPRRLLRLEAALAALHRDLRAIGGRLIVRDGPAREIVPAVVREAGATAVHASRDHTPFAVARDDAVGDAVDLRLFPGMLAAEPEVTGEVRVFTPFHRRWLATQLREPVAAPTAIRVLDGIRSAEPPYVAPTGDGGDGVTPDGEPEARARLTAFVAERASSYGTERDRLDLDGTSRLGADLHLGTLSPAQVLARVADEAFRRQLAWRDWASHILRFRPETRSAAWREEFRDLAWLDDEAGFAAWRDGQTGYPTVDAAMRQLAAEGWIHNRARMIAASFLAKDLLIDWRHGEAHFLRELVDGDVANNSLGWQWTAGVGTDAAPFFRVLNPVRQGERFDPQGAWVRRWVPEVARLPEQYVHRPWEAPGGPPPGYPPPIVDHATARQRALAWFRARPRPAGR